MAPADRGGLGRGYRPFRLRQPADPALRRLRAVRAVRRGTGQRHGRGHGNHAGRGAGGGRDRRRVARRPLIALGVIASAASVHIVTVAILLCLDRALGGDAPYAAYFLAMIPTQLVISIPVSIAGWGLREQSLVILLG
ncbi:MAG: lysylphosphatidylglycerol synthase domain-containing protein, partial [Alphaproteobacteria bacterium]